MTEDPRRSRIHGLLERGQNILAHTDPVSLRTQYLSWVAETEEWLGRFGIGDEVSRYRSLDGPRHRALVEDSVPTQQTYREVQLEIDERARFLDHLTEDELRPADQASIQPIDGQLITTRTGRTYRWYPSRHLGSGRFGDVYEADLAGDGKALNASRPAYACKRIPVREDRGTDRWVTDARLTEREVNIGRVLIERGAQGVLPIVDEADADGVWTLLMPRADYSLSDQLTENGPLAPEEVRALLLVITDVLVELAGMSMLHRDIKPANILWHDGQWKLADFGIARITTERTATVTWAGTGSLTYWAPELFLGADPTVASDLYALGCTALEALTGTAPFSSHPDPSLAHRTVPLDVPTLHDAVLERVIREMLAKPASLRPPDARAVRDRLTRSDELTDGQVRIQRLATAATRRQQAQDAAERRKELRGERGDLSEQAFQQIIDELVELIGQATDLPRVSAKDSAWSVTAADARLLIGVIGSDPGTEDLLRLGQVEVQHVDTDPKERSIIANVFCLWRDDRPTWRLIRFDRNDLFQGPVPPPERTRALGSTSSAISNHHLEQWLRERDAKLGPHIPQFTVEEAACTAETLLEWFASEAEAISTQLYG